MPTVNKKSPKYKELYGTIMQATTLDTERKNLQWLTNQLVIAAKEDLQEDKHNADKNITATTSEGKTIHMGNFGSLTKFNEFIKELKDKHSISIEEDRLIDLKSTYHTLKGELKKTRVLGVGKTLSEKVKTMVANTFQRIIPKAMLAAVGFATGPILGVGLVASGITPVSKLGATRTEMKKQLRQAIHGDTNLSEAVSTGKKLLKSMVGISSDDEQKKLKTQKLWKKDKSIVKS